MESIIITQIQKYWKVLLPLVYGITILQFSFSAQYRWQFWLGLFTTFFIIVYLLLEIFFKGKKVVEIINSYPAYSVPEGAMTIVPHIFDVLTIYIPNKMKVNKSEEITLKLDSKKPFIIPDIQKKSNKKISDMNFRITLSSPSIKLSPENEVNLSELSNELPVGFKWVAEGETIGQKKIIIRPNKELAEFLNMSSEQTRNWVENVHVVNEIGISSSLVKWFKYGALVISFCFSIPILSPLFSQIGEGLKGNSNKLENSIKDEIKVLDEISKSENADLNEEDISWHLKNLKAYETLLSEIKKRKDADANSLFRLFTVKYINYRNQIFPILRKKFSKIISQKNNQLQTLVNEESKTLFISSEKFQDPLFVKGFLSEFKDTLSRFEFSNLCIKSHLNESATCLVNIELLNKE